MKASQLNFHFITLFPETIRVWLTTSILGRAWKEGLFTFETYALRDFTTDRHRTVDDVAYGGGGGMVLKVEPLVVAVEAIREKIAAPAEIIYFSPAGRPLSQDLLLELEAPTQPKHFILICGHYEGVDERFIEHWVTREVSLGDFVLTGGELPAVAMADALIRRIEGALGNATGPETESFSLKDGSSTLLEYPHYTRPAEFRGIRVPDVLLSGDHAVVADWRNRQSRERTLARRPDLLANRGGPTGAPSFDKPK